MGRCIGCCGQTDGQTLATWPWMRAWQSAPLLSCVIGMGELSLRPPCRPAGLTQVVWTLPCDPQTAMCPCVERLDRSKCGRERVPYRSYLAPSAGRRLAFWGRHIHGPPNHKLCWLERRARPPPWSQCHRSCREPLCCGDACAVLPSLGPRRAPGVGATRHVCSGQPWGLSGPQNGNGGMGLTDHRGAGRRADETSALCRPGVNTGRAGAFPGGPAARETRWCPGVKGSVSTSLSWAPLSCVNNAGVQKNSFVFSRCSSQKPHVTTVLCVVVTSGRTCWC